MRSIGSHFDQTDESLTGVLAEPRGVTRRGNGERWLRWLLIAGFLILVAVAIASPSATPTVLRRYSVSWFCYQLFNGFTLWILCMPERWPRLRSAGNVLVIVSSFAATRNDSIAQLPAATLFLPGLRLLAGADVLMREFEQFRKHRVVRGWLVGLGSTVVVLSMLDLGLWLFLHLAGHVRPDDGRLRETYALDRITPDDIVLVGDSFVWGHGVATEERFGNVLEQLYRRQGSRTRVYSLGIRGAAPAEYLQLLARVPASVNARLVILSFYPNDIEERPRPWWMTWGNGTLWELGRSSLSLRALVELRHKLVVPTLRAYVNSLVDDYRPGDPTFPGRWARLRAELHEFQTRAVARSTSRPLLVILPIMVDFRRYPLTETHRSLGLEAETLGYDVLDLLPPFRVTLIDGIPYQVSPDDNHFNAAVHRLTAELIKKHLDERARSHDTNHGDRRARDG